MKNTENLKDIARLFLKLGIIGFGGPAAHISMMQNEVVTKRKWISQQHFLDLIGATNLIPGPNSTEMAIHIGREKAGWKGLITAGVCFILPAVFITGIFAWLYKKYGALPEIQPFVYGIKPAIIAVILSAIFPLAEKSFKSIGLIILVLLVLTGSLLGYNEIFLLFGAGILYVLITFLRPGRSGDVKNLIPIVYLQSSEYNLITSLNFKLFLIFLKVGSILYGSGYVLFAFLDAELVASGMMNRQQLIDAIAVGQFTPGPVFSSVTFIGYQINGWVGAAVSTLGIFLPSFLFVALLNPLVKKMRNSKIFSVFLDAVNAASVAIIVSVCISMGIETVTDWRTILIAVVCLYISFRYRKINSALIVVSGSIMGYLLNLL
ncbi:chromate efflux transporter [Chryseobacterium nepalense]|uniref:Chromate efflux transporter n=1 Tax=Chryseobacterium nepalense TaxID=1854498 RepID=A0ABY4K7D6_9FLAO|nr:chromate efflux transporter [Chryseobacterium nepalense]UPQ76683.1 chromate efflux transporter [Chryseobacterium nepalense]